MELLLMKREEGILSVLADGRRILQIHAEEEGNPENTAVGDIYVGKVRNVVKNINAAFVEFAKGKMGYLSLAEKAVPIHTSGGRQDDGRVLIGDEIIVQIKQEAIKTKPPALTGMIDLTGRYIVLTIGKNGCNVSKKIKDKEKRKYLLELLGEYRQEDFLLIARTNSSEASEKVLRREMEKLIDRYDKLRKEGIHKVAMSRLERALPVYLADIRDGYAAEVDKIITDDQDIYEKVYDHLTENDPESLQKLTMWSPENGKLDAVYNVSRSLEHALMPKVWLKSGAYLVIQPTEALISIDVNTGKAISKKKDVQKTFYKINVEAAREIAVQMRLRNLSGIVLVDFIDMKSEEDQKSLMEILRQEVRKDPVQTTVVDMTKLGLVEITRKKARKSLYEQINSLRGSERKMQKESE